MFMKFSKLLYSDIYIKWLWVSVSSNNLIILISKIQALQILYHVYTSCIIIIHKAMNHTALTTTKHKNAIASYVTRPAKLDHVSVYYTKLYFH